MADDDRMRSEIARMQMRGDELTDEVCWQNIIILYGSYMVQKTEEILLGVGTEIFWNIVK